MAHRQAARRAGVAFPPREAAAARFNVRIDAATSEALDRAAAQTGEARAAVASRWLAERARIETS